MFVGERSHFEGTNTPSKGFLLTFCPRRQKVTKNAFGVRVNAEVATLCVPTSIACQRYHTPDSPHLRHGRPPRCSLVAFYRPNWSNQGQKEGREMFARCPKETSPRGYRKTFGCANATPKILLPKSSWGFGGVFQEAPKRIPRPPSNPNLSHHCIFALWRCQRLHHPCGDVHIFEGIDGREGGGL